MLSYVVRWVYRRCFPQRLRNALSLSLTEVETFQPPRVVDLPPGRCILVLAPHADDETLGCGGTLHKYRRAGARVHVIFLTDGALGNRELRSKAAHDPSRPARECELAHSREIEAANALSILEVSEYTFLRQADGKLRCDDQQLIRRLAELLVDFRPDIIFLPFLTDRHPDHVATTGLLIASIEATPLAEKSLLWICAYEIWAPLYANILVDITDTLSVKRSAIAAYPSQLQESDYLDGIVGLNRYRGLSSAKQGRYCESFFLSTYPHYRNLYERMQRW